jgi:hypothetical protein
MKTYDIDQATLFIELVRVTRIHQKAYFASRNKDDLIRSKDGESRIDLFLAGNRLNNNLTIVKKVVQANLFDEKGHF